MTPSEAFEQTLSKGDSCNIRGKFIFNANLSVSATSPLNILTINSDTFGTRIAAISLQFARYHYKYIRFKFLGVATAASLLTLTSGIIALGVQDDASQAEGSGPITVQGLAEQRCSATAFLNQTTPTEFIWRPNDPSLWYYTFAGATASEPRLVDQGVLFGGLIQATNNATVASVSVEADFSIVLKGAIDTSTT
jgi:hypothetical protein